MAPLLITGVAGFVGNHLALRFLDEGFEVVGLDNLNDYYERDLKLARLARLANRPAHTFVHLDIADKDDLSALFDTHRFKLVVHLAAQAGVRHSLTHPHAYVSSNIDGFLNVLECCRRQPVEHLLYASSSSVYGAATATPFSPHQNVDHPISLYAATKKANELMAHSYSHLFGIPTTGMRFFTVYGPWGRPDMALFMFTKAILAEEPIEVFNNGRMERDFTYVDDIVEAVRRLSEHVAAPDPAWRSDKPDPSGSSAPYRLYNIGNGQAVNLVDMIGLLEKKLGRQARKVMLPAQPGDVLSTCADVSDLKSAVNYSPTTSLETGIDRFVDWYRGYYRV